MDPVARVREFLLIILVVWPIRGRHPLTGVTALFVPVYCRTSVALWSLVMSRWTNRGISLRPQSGGNAGSTFANACAHHLTAACT